MWTNTINIINLVISGISIPGLEPLHSVKYNRFMYFTFITEHSKQQGASALLTMITGFYIRRESTTYIYTMYISSKNWELETC